MICVTTAHTGPFMSGFGYLPVSRYRFAPFAEPVDQLLQLSADAYGRGGIRYDEGGRATSEPALSRHSLRLVRGYARRFSGSGVHEAEWQRWLQRSRVPRPSGHVALGEASKNKGETVLATTM